VIADALAGLDAGSFLDLGCAEGYFVMQAARRGWIALGVDGDLRRLAVAQNVALCDGLSRAGFLHGSITAGFVRKLPCFDVVLFLSVLHHVMCEQGVSGASELLRAIRSRTGMRLIFDMGQSNETTYDWAPLLPRMDPDPATWITGLLESCGFSSVRIIGETQGFMGAHPRHLFLAEP
jgi:O-antigen chain-terminating methyltransferase